MLLIVGHYGGSNLNAIICDKWLKFRCNSTADIRLIDAGHFALEIHSREIALAMDQFLSPRVRER